MTAGEPLAFLGLGVMGGPMAGHLAAAGHTLRVYNRSADKAQRWVAEHGGTACATPAEAADGAAAVIACVGADDSVRAVFDGPDGALGALAPGALAIDHTTASAQVAREMSRRAAARGIGFVDAPVSGGEAGARGGTLTIMAGGEAADVARAEALWSCYGKSATHIGPSGSGQLAKMVNQICIGGVLQGLSEAIRFLEACDLPAKEVFAAIGQGAAQSWQMDHRALTMVAREFEFGFAVDWMRKDLGLALAEAARHGVALPLTRQVDEAYARVQSLGGGRYDTSSLILAAGAADDSAGE